MKIIFFLITIFSMKLISSEIKKDKYPRIDEQNYSGKYFSGKFLVYDCQDKHWVCTDKEGIYNCKNAVENALKTVAIELPCFVAKEFESLSECGYYNNQIVTNLAPTRECFHPKFKERIILYE